ncbi:hypothetical protein D3C87_587890 [compost metagenome]
MTDKVAEILNEEDEAEQLKVVADAIAQLMGGSASDYALEQLGNGMYAMVFDEAADLNIEDVVQKLNARAEASKLDYPEGASPLNMFDESATRMIQ